jgi:hypothetical protein
MNNKRIARELSRIAKDLTAGEKIFDHLVLDDLRFLESLNDVVYKMVGGKEIKDYLMMSDPEIGTVFGNGEEIYVRVNPYRKGVLECEWLYSLGDEDYEGGKKYKAGTDIKAIAKDIVNFIKQKQK